MKEWLVIHKIKSLYNNGNGLTERKIAQELGISRNTVSKYLNMSDSAITKESSKNKLNKSIKFTNFWVVTGSSIRHENRRVL